QTKRAQLDWKKQYKIIAATARGIIYLHRNSRLLIIKCGFKQKNNAIRRGVNIKDLLSSIYLAVRHMELEKLTCKSTLL
ncbi:putative cysteine-rich receptor-like protein kinase 33, partial [Mucuna pruriens]